MDFSLSYNSPEACKVPKIVVGKFGSDAGAIGIYSLNEAITQDIKFYRNFLEEWKYSN